MTPAEIEEMAGRLGRRMFSTFGPVGGMDRDDWTQEAAVALLGVLEDGIESQGGPGLAYHAARLRLLRRLVEPARAQRRREPSMVPIAPLADDWSDGEQGREGIEREILIRECLTRATPAQRRAVALSLAGFALRHHESCARWHFYARARESMGLAS